VPEDQDGGVFFGDYNDDDNNNIIGDHDSNSNKDYK
jgi:hypothetical protein